MQSCIYWRVTGVTGDSESVVGIIAANARLGIGFEQVHLVITDRRIIIMHGAKRGSRGLASPIIMGGHSGSFVDPDKPKVSLEGKKNLEGLDPEKIIASHKNNFGLNFSELISVQVEDGRESTSITVVTGDDKFQFFTRELAKEVSSLLSRHLGPRLVMRNTRTWSFGSDC
jgi:hypothetical protein